MLTRLIAPNGVEVMVAEDRAERLMSIGYSRPVPLAQPATDKATTKPRARKTAKTKE